MRSFGSDNHSGVHPEILKALLAANVDHAPAYGTDELSARADLAFQKHFGRHAKIFYLFNGTGANVLSMKVLLRSYQSVLASENAHLAMDECGAPEAITGSKIVLLPEKNGKIVFDSLADALVRRGDQHHVQARAITLTQPTEYGTCYTMDELRALSAFARKNSLYLHIDGARLSNACVFLGKSYAEMTTELGVDLVSFGGTKNGFLFGEALVCLRPELAEHLKYARKQLTQLPSKTRFVAAQFERYLEGDLWKEIATQVHASARGLEKRIREFSKLEITQPVESNAVFVKIPQAWVKPLREHYFFYVWDEKTFECRLMTSFDTTSDDIDGFAKQLENLQRQK